MSHLIMDGQHHCGRRTMAGGWLGSCASNEATKRMSLVLHELQL